jgi:hypothetical protein
VFFVISKGETKMKGHRYSAVGLFLVLALSIGMIPRSMRADDFDLEKPIRIRVTAVAHPIGTIESLGLMAVNGRRIQGKSAL